MALISIVDIKLFVIRLVVFFLAIGMLITIFISFQSVIETNEQERSLNNLAQNFLNSGLTAGFAVLDPAKLNDINAPPTRDNPTTEPVRFCGRGALFEVFERSPQGAFEKKWEFGYNPLVTSGFAGAGARLRSEETQFKAAGGTRREYIAWLKEGEALVPGKARITLWGAEATIAQPAVGGLGGTIPPLMFLTESAQTIPTDIAALGCAVERAWLYKATNAAEYQCIGGCTDFTIEDSIFCSSREANEAFRRECRRLPDFVKGVSLEAGTVDPRSIVKFNAIPIKEGSPPNCDSPQLPGPQENVGRVILCPIGSRIGPIVKA